MKLMNEIEVGKAALDVKFSVKLPAGCSSV
jgi:hypothetical protein